MKRFAAGLGGGFVNARTLDTHGPSPLILASKPYRAVDALARRRGGAARALREPPEGRGDAPAPRPAARPRGDRARRDTRIRAARVHPPRGRGARRRGFGRLRASAFSAAARALGCDFVPLAEEPYELALDALQLADPRVAVLLEIVASAALRAQIAALGGYDPARSRTSGTSSPPPAAAPA